MNTEKLLTAVETVAENFEHFQEKQTRSLADLGGRLERIEAQADRPGTRANESDGERRIEALGYLGKGLALQEPKYLAKAEQLLEVKTASGLTDEAGGAAIQEQLGDEIWAEVRKSGGLIELVRTTEIDTAPGSYKRIVSTTGTTSGWVGEAGTRTATNTPVFNVATASGGMLYSYPAVSEELLASSAYNIGEFLLSEISQDFRVALATAILTGNGSNRPTGLLNSAPVSTADDSSPERAFGTIQYLPTGAASGFQSDYTSSPHGDPFAVFWDTVAALRSQYRRNASWVMNSSTLAAIGKLRDADGRSLLQPSPIAGAPMVLLGYPIVVEEQVADVGSDALAVLFGDFRMAYELVSNFSLRVTRDEVSTIGLVKLYARSYVGGTPANTQAAKAIKCATS